MDSGLSGPTLGKIRRGGDFLLTTAFKLVKGSGGIITLDDLHAAITTCGIRGRKWSVTQAEAEKQAKERKADRHHRSTSASLPLTKLVQKPKPKTKPKHSKVKNLS